jgi:hypothetical protein
MKQAIVKYKNGAFMRIDYTSKVDRRNDKDIPKQDIIRLTFNSPDALNNGTYWMRPDELLDLSLICTEFLAENDFIPRKRFKH